MCFVRGLFNEFCSTLTLFFQFSVKWLSYSKYKPQGIVKVLISYQIQKTQCSIFKFTTCENFRKMNKLFVYFEKLKTMHRRKKTHKNFFLYFTTLYENFRALGSIIKIFFKNRSVPYIAFPRTVTSICLNSIIPSYLYSLYFPKFNGIPSYHYSPMFKWHSIGPLFPYV